MKATKRQNQKADILQRFASGEIDLQELKASQLGIGLGVIHFSLKGFQNKGCLPPVQIDELIIPGEEETLAPCEDAFFYTPSVPGSMILEVGTVPYDSSMSDAPRKPSIYAHIAVMTELGYRPPSGWTPEQEQSHNQKTEAEIINRRLSLKTILK